MTSDPMPADDSTAVAQRSVRLTRSITATWWYTLSGVAFLEAALILVWTAVLAEAGYPRSTLAIVLIGGALWWLSTMMTLTAYRRRDGLASVMTRRLLASLFVALAYGLVAGLLSGLWVMGVLPLVQSLALLSWPKGVRLRVVIAGTVVLAGLWIVDAQRIGATDGDPIAATGWLFGFYTVFLPVASVLTLWWWDVLIALDHARAAEARLAATQERLRVATDVHDLQGHHLQVIALQLELAERLLDRDPAASREQLRAARGSVDEARQGTRDLALRFRSVPLRDEIANAVDLLRAAGTDAHSTVDSGADAAPAGVLGPVVRETTTNVLRHGGGRWARLSLTQDGASWRYEIVNDVARDTQPRDDGAGLEGLERRAAEAGGILSIRRGTDDFAVSMTVPVDAGGTR